MRPWVVPVMHHVRVGWIFTQRERERARGRKRDGVGVGEWGGVETVLSSVGVISQEARLVDRRA